MVSVIFVTITLCLSANSVLAQQQLPVFCNLVDCRDPVCPGGALPVIPPGQCCKVCSGPPNCAVVSCLARDCPGAFVPPGQCCPQCPVDCSLVDCLQDPVCPGGARSFIPPGQCCGVCPDPPNCAAVLCLARDCRGAFVPPGQCCQVCPDCSMVRCASVLDCPGGAPSFVPPGECCAQCPVSVDPCASFPCLNGGSCHELGNTFTCECELGFRGRYCEIGSQGKCPAPGIGICVEECTSDTDCAGNQKCCSNGCGHVCTDPVVSGCSWKGQTYAEGSQFMDDCNQCFCRSGVVGCTRKGCPVGGCVHNNTWYPNEASFKDDCNTCICNMGSVACTEMACVGCVHNGVTHPVGSTFKVDCNTCTCRSNGFPICTLIACMDCRLVRCAAPTCRHPVTPPGACCGVCDQGCDFEGALYNEGERVPCVERCGPCVCLGGTVQEQRRPCPPPRCPNPVTPSGACCPVCEQGCDFEGVWYNEGERVPCVERCGPCVCLGGRVTEQRRPCPHPPCPNPVTPPGACCPVCEQGCDFEGVWYNEGERVPCIERCGPCVCLGGRVTEQRRPCLPPRCPNPVTPPGACCPVCRGRGRRVGWGSNPGRGSGRGRQGRQVVQGDNPGEYH